MKLRLIMTVLMRKFLCLKFLSKTIKSQIFSSHRIIRFWEKINHKNSCTTCKVNLKPFDNKTKSLTCSLINWKVKKIRLNKETRSRNNKATNSFSFKRREKKIFCFSTKKPNKKESFKKYHRVWNSWKKIVRREIHE